MKMIYRKNMLCFKNVWLNVQVCKPLFNVSLAFKNSCGWKCCNVLAILPIFCTFRGILRQANKSLWTSCVLELGLLVMIGAMRCSGRCKGSKIIWCWAFFVRRTLQCCGEIKKNFFSMKIFMEVLSVVIKTFEVKVLFSYYLRIVRLLKI